MCNLMVLIPSKQCSRCKIEYPATSEYFNKRAASPDGLQPTCKVCKKIKDKKTYQTNRVKTLHRMKEYYLVNKLVLLEYQRQYREANKEKIIEYRTSVRGYLRIVYGAMVNRCINPKKHNYTRYGGRGIKVCFTSNEFVDYVINELQVDPRGLQIDRIDNDGDYERGNIRFVTNKVNCQNRG